MFKPKNLNHEKFEELCALAAIGQIFPIYFVIIALGVGLSIGSTSLIANNIGSNNLNKASKIFAQSISPNTTGGPRQLSVLDLIILIK